MNALRQFYLDFGLYEFTGPGIVYTDRITGLPSPAYQVQNRLRTDEFMAWVRGDSQTFLEILTRLRFLCGAIIGYVDTSRSRTRGLTYLTWLLTRLRDDQMQTILTRWPQLALALTARLDAPPTPPDLNFQLTDRQWELIATILPGSNDRATLDRILSDATSNVSKYQAAPEIQEWLETGQLGLALTILFNDIIAPHLSHYQFSRHLIDASDQPLVTAFLTDGIVEMARHAAPRVHRALVYLKF